MGPTRLIERESKAAWNYFNQEKYFILVVFIKS